MRNNIAIVGCLLLSGHAAACLAQAPATSIVAATPLAPAAAVAIPGVVAAGVRLEAVKGGFAGTEGVIGLADGSVLFCEQNADRIIRIGPGDVFTTYVEKANRAIGLGVDATGRLVAVQSREPRLGILRPTVETLADSFAGQPLVRPNDLVIDRKGGIYFTDPLPNPGTAFREPPPGRTPLLFYRRPDGTLIKLTDEVAEPNGVQLSPDGRTLYAANGGHIDAFDVRGDGSVANRRSFADVRGDGLAMDDAGRLYAATQAGIEVIAPDGRRLGLIPATVRIQSIAFAGKDRRLLYAVGSNTVFRVQMLATGIRSRLK